MCCTISSQKEVYIILVNISNLGHIFSSGNIWQYDETEKGQSIYKLTDTNVLSCYCIRLAKDCSSIERTHRPFSRCFGS
jgi:hypothetical protein